MKAIILISSIFYILGIKISNKIDLFKHNNPVDKIITNKISVIKTEKTTYFKDEISLKSETDSIKNMGIKEKEIRENK